MHFLLALHPPGFGETDEMSAVAVLKEPARGKEVLRFLSRRWDTAVLPPTSPKLAISPRAWHTPGKADQPKHTSAEEKATKFRNPTDGLAETGRGHLSQKETAGLAQEGDSASEGENNGDCD